MPLPSELATRCPVVNSRVVLSGAQAIENQAGEYVFRTCSNLDNCYHRSDFVESIPECRLHELRRAAETSAAEQMA